MRKKERNSVLKAFNAAEKKAKPGIDDMFLDVYAVKPAHLLEQVCVCVSVSVSVSVCVRVSPRLIVCVLMIMPVLGRLNALWSVLTICHPLSFKRTTLSLCLFL